MGDQEVAFKAGESAGQILGSWRAARDASLASKGTWQDEVLIWSQPAAWCDQVICQWCSDYIQSWSPRTLLIVDCLGSQWQE